MCGVGGGFHFLLSAPPTAASTRAAEAITIAIAAAMVVRAGLRWEQNLGDDSGGLQRVRVQVQLDSLAAVRTDLNS